MSIDFITVGAVSPARNFIDTLVVRLKEREADLGKIVIYSGWPRYTDYDAKKHQVDVALLVQHRGLYLIKFIFKFNEAQAQDFQESISQAAATAHSQFIKSPRLRGRRRGTTRINVTPILYSFGDGCINSSDVEFFRSEPSLLNFIVNEESSALDDQDLEEIRSIVEGAKALTRAHRRPVSDEKREKLAAALAKLEDEIAVFDQKQRQVALSGLGGPQRIRGLAGSGKTVILAMRAALAHLENPTSRILVTFYTRSLRDQLTRLITKFYRHFGENDPDWRFIHVYHGWGRRDLAGAYREACLRAGVIPIEFAEAQRKATGGQSPFDYACRQLLANARVAPYYDVILIDEGQDFPSGFYELCFHMAKGDRDKKQIVWAYDELQNIFDVRVRQAEELFGTDEDGEARVSLPRALPTHAETNDFVLRKCYRNQRDILVLAHASGFGVYGTPVQMLQNKDHWEDVGYEVLSGEIRVGTDVVVRRPDRHSPTRLATPEEVPLIEVRNFGSFSDEVSYCLSQLELFLAGGLQPEDLMVIAVDDRAARSYLAAVAEGLARKGVQANNIIADRYSEPPFTIEGKCTLSTVYRAKGNEAAVVIVMGCDAIPLASRSGRNRLFTAFTRTKGWLRICGTGTNFLPLQQEIERALRTAPEMRFRMPDPKTIETIQRDLSEKDARIQRAREEMERLKDALGLSDADLATLLEERRRNGRT